MILWNYFSILSIKFSGKALPKGIWHSPGIVLGSDSLIAGTWASGCLSGNQNEAVDIRASLQGPGGRFFQVILELRK